MDSKKKIAEIREALKKASSWGLKSTPWIVVNAPEWLVFLLDELERLEREYAEERAAHNAHVTELCELEKENRKLREERDKLIEGLRWYGDKSKYNFEEYGSVPVLADRGAAARSILSRYERGDSADVDVSKASSDLE